MGRLIDNGIIQLLFAVIANIAALIALIVFRLVFNIELSWGLFVSSFLATFVILNILDYRARKGPDQNEELTEIDWGRND